MVIDVVSNVPFVLHRGSKQQLPRFLYFQKFDVLRNATPTGVDDAEPRDDGAHEINEALTVYNEIRTKGFDLLTEGMRGSGSRVPSGAHQ